MGKIKKSYHKHSAFCILHSAFTLIELMVVMVVISIMVGFTIPISKYVVHRARQANQRIYIEKIKSALEDYRAAYGEYPITPVTNTAGLVVNPDDAVRHYPPSYATECYHTTNSPYTNVSLASSTVESLATGGSYVDSVDYCLTYPLMLRQLESGARPFMEFTKVTVTYLVYKNKVEDTFYRKRKKKSGDTYSVPFLRILGNPVNRYKAIDPVSQRQWKYTSLDGVTYSLTTNSF